MCGGLVRDLCSQIPADELAVPGCSGGAPPFSAGSGWPQVGFRLEDYIPAFCFLFFFFLRKQQQQKQAENENLTSGQARILFWKREVCVLFSTWPSKSLAIVEPGDT